MTLMVSLWISHGGWQSHLKDKCHTPLRGNSEYPTHDHFCFASLRFHIFSHTITLLLLKYHKNYRTSVCTCIYLFIYWRTWRSSLPVLPAERTPLLTMGHVCGLSAWSSLNKFLHQRPQLRKIIMSLDVPTHRASSGVHQQSFLSP